MANDSQGGDSIDSVDYISSLPDDILHSILSLVPTFLAIKTCVLSRRWRHIWCKLPSLFFECNEASIENVTKSLFNHTACKLLSFHLGFRFDNRCYEFDFTNGHEFFIVDTWIDFAIAYEPENLSLDLYLYHYPNYSFPDIFYVNSSVKRLSLVLHRIITLIPRPTVFWPSLKNLCLDGCNIPDESAAKILSGCPVLESLTLNLCEMLKRLDLSKSMHLRRLEIEHRIPGAGPTEILAPHIHYLRLKTTKTPQFSLDDVSSLTEAKLNLSMWSEDTKADFLYVMDIKMLPKLHNIEKLTLGSTFLQVLYIAELRGVPFPKLKITALTLETDILRYFKEANTKLTQLRGVPGIAKLLQNSPELKKLTLNLKKCFIYREENYVDTYIDSRGLKFEVFPNSSEPKLIALFIDLVLGNTKTLETLVVRLEDNLDVKNFEELLQMAQTLAHDHNNVLIVIKHKVLEFEFPLSYLL